MSEDQAIAWYITYGDEYGSDNVFFFPTKEAASQAIDDMEEAIEDGAEYYSYRGNVPVPLYPSDIKEKLEL